MRGSRSGIVVLACFVLLYAASSATCDDLSPAVGATDDVQEEESEYSEELGSLSSESDVSTLTSAGDRRDDRVQWEGKKKRLVYAGALFLACLLFAGVVVQGIKRLPFLASTEERRAFNMIWGNRRFVYTLLSEVYDIERELTTRDAWAIAKTNAPYLVAADRKVAQMAKKDECLPGSIPVDEILEVVKEYMLRNQQMHSKVKTQLPGVLGLYVFDGRVQGLIDAVQYHLENFYETAGKYVKTLPLSRSQKAIILEKVVPIVEKLPLEPKQEDLLRAHYDIGAFTRLFLTKGKLVLAEKEVTGMVYTDLPHFAAADLVFKHLFLNYGNSHPDVKIEEVPPLIWREMVKQFLINSNAQSSYEARCQMRNEVCVHIPRETIADAIIARGLEENRLLRRRPVIAPPESSFLDDE